MAVPKKKSSLRIKKNFVHRYDSFNKKFVFSGKNLLTFFPKKTFKLSNYNLD